MPLLRGLPRTISGVPTRDDIHKASKTFIGGSAIRFTGEWTDPKYKRTHRITSYLAAIR